MLGDFRYCSSSSESSDGEDDSDTSDKSDDYIEKLVAQKKVLEDKVRDRDSRLKAIQDTLKLLNEERKELFAKRAKMIKSSNELIHVDTNGIFSNGGENGKESEELILPSTSTEPLNLDPRVRTSDNEEEFDSDNES